jgi:hypothetical protein
VVGGGGSEDFPIPPRHFPSYSGAERYRDR